MKHIFLKPTKPNSILPLSIQDLAELVLVVGLLAWQVASAVMSLPEAA
jgi:hypothetical protein